jgi:hypothetical protein
MEKGTRPHDHFHHHSTPSRPPPDRDGQRRNSPFVHSCPVAPRQLVPPRATSPGVVNNLTHHGKPRMTPPTPFHPLPTLTRAQLFGSPHIRTDGKLESCPQTLSKPRWFTCNLSGSCPGLPQNTPKTPQIRLRAQLFAHSKPPPHPTHLLQPKPGRPSAPPRSQSALLPSGNACIPAQPAPGSVATSLTRARQHPQPLPFTPSPISRILHRFAASLLF